MKEDTETRDGNETSSDKRLVETSKRSSVGQYHEFEAPTPSDRHRLVRDLAQKVIAGREILLSRSQEIPKTRGSI